MKTGLFLSVLLALITGASRVGWAQERRQHPLEEVFYSELVYTQERGEIQLTLTSRLNRQRYNGFANHLTMEYGITEAWQSEIEWEAFTHKQSADGLRARGTGDVQLGTKYAFMNIRNSNFHSAVGIELGLPSGNVENGLGEGAIEFEPYIIFAKDFPQQHHLQLFTQAGLEFSRRVKESRRDEPEGRVIAWSGGLFVPVKAFCFTGEVGLRSGKAESRRENQIYVTPGVVWRPSRDWEFGVGAQLGTNLRSDKSAVLIKLTREF